MTGAKERDGGGLAYPCCDESPFSNNNCMRGENGC